MRYGLRQPTDVCPSTSKQQTISNERREMNMSENDRFRLAYCMCDCSDHPSTGLKELEKDQNLDSHVGPPMFGSVHLQIIRRIQFKKKIIRRIQPTVPTQGSITRELNLNSSWRQSVAAIWGHSAVHQFASVPSGRKAPSSRKRHGYASRAASSRASGFRFQGCTVARGGQKRRGRAPPLDALAGSHCGPCSPARRGCASA